MSEIIPHSPSRNPLRILDVRQTVLSITPEIEGVICPNLPPLDFLLLADRLGELYEMVFPDHPEWLAEETAVWDDEEAVSGAAERFLRRVSLLFPVHDEIWDADIEVIEWRLYEIPVLPMGFDHWYEDWEHFKEPVPYLLHLMHSREDEASAYRGDSFTDQYPHQLIPRYLEPHRLVETLSKMDLPDPVNGLSDLIDMLNQDTGNAWLDVSEYALIEGGGYPLWNAEDVIWLTEQWQLAKPIWERVERLLDWQNGSPDEIDHKLTAVRDYLLAAYEQFQEEA